VPDGAARAGPAAAGRRKALKGSIAATAGVGGALYVKPSLRRFGTLPAEAAGSYLGPSTATTGLPEPEGSSARSGAPGSAPGREAVEVAPLAVGQAGLPLTGGAAASGGPAAGAVVGGLALAGIGTALRRRRSIAGKGP
jgi:hypothetical protein